MCDGKIIPSPEIQLRSTEELKNYRIVEHTYR